MPDLIGVTDMLAWTPGFAKYGQLLHPLNRLKRFALLFDRLAAFGLDVALDRPKRIWGDKQFRSELKWLRDKGILYNIEPSKIFGKQQEFTVREDLTVDEVVEKLSQDPRAFLQLATGLGTDLLRRGSRDEFVSLTAEDLRDEVFDFGATTHLHDVLYVVLANIPEPDEKTAWEDIVDFRRDPDSRRKYVALHRWVSTIARGQISARDAALELEVLRNEYEEHIKLHRMKAHTGMLETIVTTAADAAENLAKFRIGQMSRMLFKVKHRRIALLEADQIAPGREIAYINTLQKRFGKVE